MQSYETLAKRQNLFSKSHKKPACLPCSARGAEEKYAIQKVKNTFKLP
jgi:hypothetical protein